MMNRFVFLIIGLWGMLPLMAGNYPYQSNVLFVTTPDHTDWVYKTGEKAKITVAVYLYGILQEGLEIKYEAGPEQFQADCRGTARTKHGTAVIEIGTMEKPGFKDCRMSVVLKGKTYKHHIKVGFSPEKIVPTVKMPADFKAFWEKAKAEAALCPMEVTTRYVEEYSTRKVDCYEVKLQCYQKGSYVYGYLTKPKAEGKYPVVFNPPGAGIKPMDPMKTMYFAEHGMICFNMEIHGLCPSLDKETYQAITAAFRNDNSYLTNGLDDRDNYYMKKVYLACVRALDYLTSLPEYDGKNLIAQGGSQGGALALITTALDDRITLCAANHPALSDMEGYLHGQAGGYPHFFTKFNQQNKPDKLKTLAYYDVVNFARLIRVPVFMTWGYNDDTCPPTTSYAVYHVITAPKEALITPVNEHWVSTETRLEQMEWMKKKMREEENKSRQ